MMGRGRGCGVKGCGFLISLVLCLVGLGIVLYLIQPSEISLPGFFDTFQNFARLGNRQVQGPVIPLTPGGDGAPADLLIENWRLGDSIPDLDDPAARQVIPIYLSLASINNGRLEIVWEQQVGTDESNQAHQATYDRQRVYVTIGSELQALDRESGQVIWQATLSDLVNTRCKGCLQVVGDRLVVLSTDQVLQGFETAGGALMWQERLNDDAALSSSTGQAGFVVTGRQILVIDGVEKDSNSKEIRLYDPQDGTVSGRLQPVCSDPEGFFGDANLSLQDPVLVGPDDQQLTIIMKNITFVSCVQSWDLNSQRLFWESRLPEGTGLVQATPPGLLNSLAGPFFVEGVKVLYLPLTGGSGGDSAIYRIDRDSGRIDLLAAVEDYDLTPLGEQGEVLLVRAVRNRGSERNELWGLDKNTGDRLWQHELLAQKLKEVDIGIGNEWVYHLTPQGLVLLQLLDDPLQLVVQRLDPRTGQLLVDSTSNSGDRFWTGVAWDKDLAFLTLRRLVAVDYTTGEVNFTWP